MITNNTFEHLVHNIFVVIFECNVEFLNKASLQVHTSKFKPLVEGGPSLCKIKLQEKAEKKKRKHEECNARSKIKSADPMQLCNALEQQETTNDLLQKLTTQVGEQCKKIEEQTREMQHQNRKMEKLSQQNDELKDMMRDIQKNPQLVLVCNQLYPLNTLKELDLGEARFEPVRQILDKELPEYANLASKPTATVHCKAVKELNERFVLSTSKVVKKQESAKGDTVKMLIELHDGHQIDK